MQKGITIVELILVIAVIVILGTLATPFMSRFVDQNNFEATRDMLIGSLRKAQLNSMNGKNAEIWGVCIIGGQIRLYSSSCSAPGISEDYKIPSNVTIGGLSDISFSSLQGTPSVAGAFSIQSETKSSLITINDVGGMDIN